MLKGLSEEYLERLLSNVPVKRLCAPEEVALVVRFFIGRPDVPGYLTGQILSLDGGDGALRMTVSNDGRALYSYESLCARIDARISSHAVFSVILFDLDFFTTSTAAWDGPAGHHAVIRGISEMLCENGDIQAARRESDEFLLLMEGAGLDKAVHIAEEYRRRFRKVRWIQTPGYERVPIRASFGVAAWSHHLSDRFLLLKEAETALLTAKGTQPWKPHRTSGCAFCRMDAAAPGSAEAFVAAARTAHRPIPLLSQNRTELIGTGREGFCLPTVPTTRSNISIGTGIHFSGSRTGGSYAGDNGDPLRAEFSKPSGIAVHRPSGRVYIADTGNHCIRLIEDGIVRTLAGDGQEGYSGDGGDAGAARLSPSRRRGGG